MNRPCPVVVPVVKVRPFLSLSRTVALATYVPGASRVVTLFFLVSTLYLFGSAACAATEFDARTGALTIETAK